MSHPRAIARRVAVTTSAALLLASCSNAASSSNTTANDANLKPVQGGSAVFAVDSPFLGFDPNITAAAQDARVMRQAFDSLVYLDSDRKLQPWLAKSWKVSDDGRTYTFTLRDDVKFQDGTKFDAAAVCFNLDRIKDPNSGSIYAIGLIGPYQSCKATDATTAVVTLATPYAPFLNQLTSPFMGMNSPTAAKGKKPADYTLKPVGSGPYKIVSYTPNDRVVLERNPDYAWAPGNAKHTGAAYLDKLTFQIIPDATVRIGSVRNRSVQGASGVPEEQVAALKKDATLNFIAQQQSGAPYQLHFNTSRPPFNDPAVRKAARSAMDIDSAVKALYAGVINRAWGPLTPQTIAYDKSVEKSFSYDPAAAASALDAAGWKAGSDGVRVKDGKRLSITYLESSPNREKRQDIATFLQANLKKAGFDVKVNFQQTAPLQSALQNGDYDIMGLSLVAVDPNVLYQMYDPRFIPKPGKSGFNFSHTDDPKITDLLLKGQQEQDPEARAQIYAQVQQAIVGDARSVGVYVPTYTLLLNGLHGIRFDAEGYPIFYDAFVTK